jgi:H+/gluconate symporter-like permease
MDALPGTPQIQNIIPTAFFGTNAWAAPWLGTIGASFILVVGMATSNGAGARRCARRGLRRRRPAQRTGAFAGDRCPSLVALCRWCWSAWQQAVHR